MRFINGSRTRVTVALAVLGWAWYGAAEAESGSIEDRMADRQTCHHMSSLAAQEFDRAQAEQAALSVLDDS